MRTGRLQHADPQSARHARLGQGARASYKLPHLPGRQHAVQRAAPTTPISPSSTSAACDLRRRRHGGAGGGREALARRSPAARSSKATACRETSPSVDLQPDRHRRPTPAPSACRCPTPRSRSSTTTATRCRSAQPGEIAIKGPQVMAGYWQRPDETAKVMTADGFFKSGDIGVMDERGYFKIVDRKKDMILVSGFNVYPERDRGRRRAAIPACSSAPRSACRTRSPARRSSCSSCGSDPSLTEADAARPTAQATHRLQAAEVRRVPRRAAEDQRRQDPAPRTARRRAQEGGLGATSRVVPRWRVRPFAEGAPNGSQRLCSRRSRPVSRCLFL